MEEYFKNLLILTAIAIPAAIIDMKLGDLFFSFDNPSYFIGIPLAVIAVFATLFKFHFPPEYFENKAYEADQKIKFKQALKKMGLK